MPRRLGSTRRRFGKRVSERRRRRRRSWRIGFDQGRCGEQLVAAVDDWAVRVGKEEPARGTWMLAVARAADPDPWRNRFRDAAVWNDRTALERLAREAKVSELSPQIIYALGMLLVKLNADAIPLLTAAQRRYPSDFWLNFSLGGALLNARRWEEAIGCYRAALVLRPAASAAYNNLGIALQEGPCG